MYPRPPSILSFLLFFYCSAAPRDLHSFPTRRSSDLFRGDHRIALQVARFGERIGLELLDAERDALLLDVDVEDRKSTRLNSSHPSISYAVFCLKKKKKNKKEQYVSRTR